MIRVKVPMPDFNYNHGSNSWIETLDSWREWGIERGLRYLRAGSTRKTIEAGEFFIQSYSMEPDSSPKGIWPYREMCFHKDDIILAILFKLRFA